MRGFINSMEKTGPLAAVTLEDALRESGSQLVLPPAEDPVCDRRKIKPAAF